MNWTQWLGLPPLATAHGAQIDGLIGWTHVFMLILFVGWGGFFIYALFRFRRSRNPVASYTGVKSNTSKYSEIAVAVVEAVLPVEFAHTGFAVIVGVAGVGFTTTFVVPGEDVQLLTVTVTEYAPAAAAVAARARR